MKYRALRGVCIGVGRTLKPGDDPVELDSATAQFLVSIGAIEPAKDEPATKHEPEKSGKTEHVPASGKKEK